MPTDSPHNRIWTALVIAFGFFCAIGILTMLWLIRVMGADSDASESDTWVFELVASIQALYIVAITITLVLRAKKPSLGRLLTKALNIALLVTAVPIGTALGIYGLWKVDRA